MNIKAIAIGSAILAGGALGVGIILSENENGQTSVTMQKVSEAAIAEINDEKQRLSEASSITEEEGPIRIAVLETSNDVYASQYAEVFKQYEDQKEKAKRAVDAAENILCTIKEGDDGEIEKINEIRTKVRSEIQSLESKKYDFLDFKCDSVMSHDDKLLCFTRMQRNHRDEITSNPVNKKVRKVLKCARLEHEQNEVLDEPVTSPVKDRIVLLEDVLVNISTNSVETELDRAVAAKCCSKCKDSCWVTPGNWGQCPYCLCDNSCDKYCK
jgi:hypothetical protein